MASAEAAGPVRTPPDGAGSEPGWRRCWAPVCVCVAVALGVWLFMHQGWPWAIHSGDGSHYADVARHLSRGEGFTTNIVFVSTLEFSTAEGHPELVRPPLWPLMLSGFFVLFGTSEASVQLASLFFFLAVVGMAAALAASCAGPWVGLAAGLAVAVTPDVVGASFFGVTETPYAFWTLLVFALLARRAPGFWIGVACGLAYLTRYNGAILLPIAVLLQLRQDRFAARVAACLAGFALVGLPWWIRNFVITGDPFFSLYSLAPYVRDSTGSALMKMVTPDLGSPYAIDPLEKPLHTLPKILVWWPPLIANAVACVGVALGCARRDRLSWGVLLLAVLTTGIIAIVVFRGRYFVPLLPVIVAVGAVAWARYGGRFKLPALALLVLAAALPLTPKNLAGDIFLMHHALANPEGVAKRVEKRRARDKAAAVCLAGQPLVLSDWASVHAWGTDTRVAWLPPTEEEFWTIVDRYEVDVLAFHKRHRLWRSPRFKATFVRDPRCGRGFYRRRPPSQAPESAARIDEP